MALSSNTLLARDEQTQNGTSATISGVSTVKDLLFYFRRYDDDGPQVNLLLQHRWSSNEPWITFWGPSLDTEEVGINGFSAQYLADEIRATWELHGQGTGGADFQILVVGRG